MPPQVIEAYPSLGRELAAWFGRGLGKGVEGEIETREADRRAMESFRRLTPLREAQREEEFTYETRKGKSKLAMEQQAAREKESYEAESALQSIGPYLGEMLSTTQVPPPSGADVLREPRKQPYKVPAGTRKEDIYKLLGIGMAREKAAAKTTTGRAPTHVEMQMALTNPGHPLHEQAKRYFYGEGTPAAPGKTGYVGIQRDVSGMKARGPLDVAPEYPPVATPPQMEDLKTADVLLQELDALEAGYEKNQHLLGGLLTGGGRAKRYGRQLFDLLDPEENDWIALAEQFRGGQILDFFGKVVPKGETQLAARMIPDIDVMQPNQFKAAIKATRDRIIKGQATLKKQLRTSRGALGNTDLNPDIGTR